MIKRDRRACERGSSRAPINQGGMLSSVRTTRTGGYGGLRTTGSYPGDDTVAVSVELVHGKLNGVLGDLNVRLHTAKRSGVGEIGEGNTGRRDGSGVGTRKIGGRGGGAVSRRHRARGARPGA